MPEAKTKPTSSSVESYIAAITDEARRTDCEAFVSLMSRASKQQAVMWGTAIVGFGTHQYLLAGGKVGEICAVGFSARRGDISIYGVAGEKLDSELLAKLGRHKLSKGCLYITQLGDVDLKVLEKLIAQAAKSKQV